MWELWGAGARDVLGFRWALKTKPCKRDKTPGGHGIDRSSVLTDRKRFEGLGFWSAVQQSNTSVEACGLTESTLQDLRCLGYLFRESIPIPMCVRVCLSIYIYIYMCVYIYIHK